MPTMISTAFPNVAFKRPARVCPRDRDISSVASPSNCRGGGGDSVRLTTKVRGRPEDRTEVTVTHFGKGDDREEAESKAQGRVPVEIVSGRGDRHEQ